MNNAVFFDRDGVINKERKDYVKTADELEIYENIIECIKKLKDNKFIIIVITNQSAVNRGLTVHKNIQKIHDKLQSYLKNHGTEIDAFYYCPHKPDEGCACRKPKPGLIINASKDWNINLHSSWMIGNNDSDVLAGKAAGCKSIKIEDNSHLPDAIKIILES